MAIRAANEQPPIVGRPGPSKVGAYADVFNVTNQGIANRYYQISGHSFGTPNSWSNPRILRAGLRVTF